MPKILSIRLQVFEEQIISFLTEERGKIVGGLNPSRLAYEPNDNVNCPRLEWPNMLKDFQTQSEIREIVF